MFNYKLILKSLLLSCWFINFMNAGLWESLDCRRPAPSSRAPSVVVMPERLHVAPSATDGTSTSVKDRRASVCCTRARAGCARVQSTAATCVYPVTISISILALSEVIKRHVFNESYIFKPNGDVDAKALAFAGGIAVSLYKLEAREARRLAFEKLVREAKK